MIKTTSEQNKARVLEAFDTLFNKRDYDAASRFWSDKYMQHSAHIEPGREGLFGLIRSLPDSLRYEHGLILAEGDYVGSRTIRGVGGRRRGEDRERCAGRALGRTPGRSDQSRIQERIADVRRPLSRMTQIVRHEIDGRIRRMSYASSLTLLSPKLRPDRCGSGHGQSAALLCV